MTGMRHNICQLTSGCLLPIQSGAQSATICEQDLCRVLHNPADSRRKPQTLTCCAHAQATWLLGLLRQDEAAAAAALRQVPESVVKDMASWLSFCIRMGRAGAPCFLRLHVTLTLQPA